MRKLFKEMSAGVRRGIEVDGRWLFRESATVADIDDPDNQHRIKVVIPSIDEDQVYDDWVRPASLPALGDGFGIVFIPPVGDEVLVSGVLGQKYNLVYEGSVYNEEVRKSPQLSKDTPGIHSPQNLSFIATLLLKLQAQNIHAIAEQLARVTGENIESLAGQLNKITGNAIELTAGGQCTVNGQTISLQADGSLQINGGSVSIQADGSVQINGSPITVHADGAITISAGANVMITATGTLMLQGRVVNKFGPAI